MADTKLTIHEAKPLDCVRVAMELRNEDLGEIIVSCGDVDPARVLLHQIEQDGAALAVYFDGRPAALLGCANGIPWMLGTVHLEGNPRLVVSLARQYVDRWLAEHGRLWNTVWSGAERNVAFLRYLGFTVEPEVDGHHEFHMEAA